MDELDFEKLEERRARLAADAEALGREWDAWHENEQRLQRERDERAALRNPPMPSMASLTGDMTTTFTTRDLERERAGREPKPDDKPRTLRERFRALFV